MRIDNALISVSDKTGLAELAKVLVDAGTTIYSTGGTAAALRELGITVREVAELTGVTEMLDGRVKTLHSHIYAAILADGQNDEHRGQLADCGVPKLDLLVVNFYPFERAASSGDEKKIIENIDIGGPAMVRAAAKNHSSTAVLVDPADYPVFVNKLKNNGGGINAESRRWLASKAFVSVAHLDCTIANHFASRAVGAFPDDRFLHLEKITDLPYGENPHQAAACYGIAGGVDDFAQLQGTPASYNNLLDSYSACMAAGIHDRPAAAVVKHSNPCGVAVADDLKTAFQLARKTDPVSAYGGVVAFNRPLDGETAAALKAGFWEVVCAPQFDAEAKAALAMKSRLRILLSSLFETKTEWMVGNANMLLMQSSEAIAGGGEVVSRRQPSETEWRDLEFAWRVVAVVKSNAIVIAESGATVGIGAGQMSRVDSAWLACEKARRAKQKMRNAVAASDGFFPFADGVQTLATAGVAAVIQPGGSKNDEEVVKMADAHDMAMVFTGRRYFRH